MRKQFKKTLALQKANQSSKEFLFRMQKASLTAFNEFSALRSILCTQKLHPNYSYPCTSKKQCYQVMKFRPLNIFSATAINSLNINSLIYAHYAYQSSIH